MVWGILAGEYYKADQAKDASQAQISAAQDGIEAQERMFERGLELQAPYREAGYRSLEGLEGLTSPEGRAAALQGFYASPEYTEMQKQAEGSAARRLGATGGLRGGSSYETFESIAPQLGQNFLAGEYDRFSGLANLGMGAASQGASGAQYLGGAQASGFQEIGEAEAYRKLAQGQIFSNTFGTLAGLGMQAGGI